MSTVSADDLPHLHRFVRGLDTDHAGVRNALTLPYSSGTVYCLLITAAKKHIVDEHDPSWLPGSNDEIAETPRILNTMRGLGEYLTIAAERRTGRSR
ncbi:hypothetical protein [Nocardia sp. NPDC049526]|uniref:hypothetical protein n=1 Tax=Nocardia sp. NPDC049526 TaxID=3364316 RepID=UPI0037A198DA